MANTKISAATDAGTLVGTDRVPLARSGSTTAYSTSLTALQGYVAISPYTSVPYMDGAGAAGGSALYSRGDHVHPSDTSKLSLSGGVMTGPLTLSADGTAALHATTKQQLDAAIAAVPAGAAPSGATPAMDGTGAPGSSALYSRGDHVHPNDTSRMPIAGGTFTGTVTLAADPAAALQPATKQYADAASLRANIIHNSGFSVNQRGYTSGTALAAAAYGFDRWKAGASGCTLTFTASPPTTTVTITAGSLQQIVEGAGVRGGNHTLSWTGTAQGRIGAGSYAASPVTASLTAGANATVEFNAGTLSNPKLEEGGTATPLARRDPADELALCQRFYQIGQLIAGMNGTNGFALYMSSMLPVPMRGAPALTVTPTMTANLGAYSIGSYSSSSGGFTSVWISATPTATATVNLGATFTASADL